MSYHHGGHNYSGSHSSWHAEKISQFTSAFIVLLGIVETFFVIKNGESFLSANIPYVAFDIYSPSYGFIIAITTAVALAVLLGLALRTLAIIGVLFWVSISGVVSCSSKGVHLTPLQPNNQITAAATSSGAKRIQEHLDNARSYITNRREKPLANANPDNAVAKTRISELEKTHPDFAKAIRENRAEAYLIGLGYERKQKMTSVEVDWCTTQEGDTALFAGDVRAWMNCSTRYLWSVLKVN